MKDILKKDGLSLELLEDLSYQSGLGIRLKKNLHHFNREALFEELVSVNKWYDTCELLHGVIIDYRIKSIQSAMMKYERYYPDHQAAKVFNEDDGYRGVHVYFQMSNFHYPIEIQYNTFYDRQLNNWLHKYVYKRKYEDHVGSLLRQAYEAARIRNEDEFREVLENVLSDCEKV